MKKIISERAQDSLTVLKSFVEQSAGDIENMSKILFESMMQGGKVYIIGNGGSAADAQHFASELTGRFQKSRPGLPAIALTTDSSALTAIGNDYGFEHIFARQVDALITPSDVLLAISTSGKSKNIVLAAKVAMERGAQVVALTGQADSDLSQSANLAVKVPSSVTARIQESHIFALHTTAELIEEYLMQEFQKGCDGCGGCGSENSKCS